MLGHHLRGVARVVPLEDLEDAPGMLERGIGARRVPPVIDPRLPLLAVGIAPLGWALVFRMHHPLLGSEVAP